MYKIIFIDKKIVNIFKNVLNCLKNKRTKSDLMREDYGLSFSLCTTLTSFDITFPFWSIW